MLRTLAVTLALLALPLVAQDMPSPGKEHQQLTKSAGTWDAVIETVGMDGKPAQSKGVSVRRVGPGGFFVIDEFEGEMMGMKFTGHGTTGFDPMKGKYVGTWCDGMSPTILVLEGSMDAAGKVLTMTCKGPDMTGKMVDMRMVTTMVDADHEVFEMFMPGPDGKEMQMLKITYTRRAAKKPAEPAKK